MIVVVMVGVCCAGVVVVVVWSGCVGGVYCRCGGGGVGCRCGGGGVCCRCGGGVCDLINSSQV